jgi:hypothetical protein
VASNDITPGQIDYGDVGDIETVHLGYFDPDELRP